MSSIGGRWPIPEDARGLLSSEALAQLAMQVCCPHLDTSRQVTGGTYGIEYCNTCGATRRYLTSW